mmetsp:Transcript_91151/g.262933  ORF Transcript_91151/g.262933 Transcript_91151/m.262933 type:complete len:226 (+) Transcript_91151:647-1324(+)
MSSAKPLFSVRRLAMQAAPCKRIRLWLKSRQVSVWLCASNGAIASASRSWKSLWPTSNVRNTVFFDNTSCSRRAPAAPMRLPPISKAVNFRPSPKRSRASATRSAPCMPIWLWPKQKVSREGCAPRASARRSAPGAMMRFPVRSSVDVQGKRSRNSTTASAPLSPKPLFLKETATTLRPSAVPRKISRTPKSRSSFSPRSRDTGCPSASDVASRKQSTTRCASQS